jgi:hypothetical protein
MSACRRRIRAFVNLRVVLHSSCKVCLQAGPGRSALECSPAYPQKTEPGPSLARRPAQMPCLPSESCRRPRESQRWPAGVGMAVVMAWVLDSAKHWARGSTRTINEIGIIEADRGASYRGTSWDSFWPVLGDSCMPQGLHTPCLCLASLQQMKNFMKTGMRLQPICYSEPVVVLLVDHTVVANRP